MYSNTGRICRDRRGGGKPCAGQAWAAGVLAVTLGLLCLPGHALEPVADPAAALHARRVALQPQLRAGAFGAPLHLASNDGGDLVEGDVHAEVAHPFADVAAAFKSAKTVCALLFMHLNVRACQPSTTAGGESLTLVVGPKRAQASDLRHQLDYALRLEVSMPAYLRVALHAPRGPLMTRDYRIVFEAVPIDARRSFVRLGYAYHNTALARFAMEAYLATAGRAKIGFTVVGQDDAGRPVFVQGERAALERNVIRYFLALEAYNSVTAGSPQERMDARLRTWFALTERHPAQLHELSLDEYLQEKHDDLAASALQLP